MILKFENKIPSIDEDTYISESTDIIGDVKINKGCSIWFGARLRGDMNKITILENSNVQENASIHVDTDFDVKIGKNVTIGHGAIVHGCHIDDNVLIGMGSIILNGAKISKNSIVGAGALVTENKEFEEGVLIIGSPARAVRKLREDEIERINESSKHYLELSKKYK
ncbi:gamma carbonic anhydrase family protein [Clostridium thermobutyricum]|uniref:2,3,4,5-tetrahydropyridine-2,6-dicarboxylate N-acetyltransferase n=1 Tax=Clostridium thermobutyricum DSM 4928 TaxID=1121339 RepID=A0A1V4SRL3_9CLOT|nr:gamma carbonic anhydrase family protein [Clostridium thermobutyricum]OPX46528.1 2,3,4,5-tetrahydropyridine-2,6-dicarboxylate N-acetyltransferase [Clostridium thermobutyricum DSM 4928]